MILQLDPGNPDAEADAIAAVAGEYENDIAAALRRNSQSVVGGLDERSLRDIERLLPTADDDLREALERLLSASAGRGARASIEKMKQVYIGVDWTLVNEDARDWARRYSYDLVNLLDDNSRTMLQGAVSRWIESGEPLDVLVDDVARIFGAERARLIAVTEATRAYAEGSFAGYEAAGFNRRPPESDRPPGHPGCRCWVSLAQPEPGLWEYVWLTAMDERVCPICAPKHRTSIGFAGRRDRATGQVPVKDVTLPASVSAEDARARLLAMSDSDEDSAVIKQIRLRMDAIADKGMDRSLSIDERRAIWSEWEVLSKEITNIQRLRDERIRSVLYVDNPASVRLDVSKSVASEVSKVWNNGAETFGRFVDKSLIPDSMTVKAKSIKSARAFYSPDVKAVNLSAKSGQRTVVHELGHWLEDINPDVHRKALEFYDRRTSGEELRWLGKGYARSEVTRRDKFISPYMGKDYNRTATEIVSMGMEYFSENPVTFAKEDPDYFDFIFNLLRGL